MNRLAVNRLPENFRRAANTAPNTFDSDTTMLTQPGKLKRRLRTIFSRTNILRRWLGREKQQPAFAEAGLIILQLDGLSREQFEEALTRRRLPFLRRLIHQGYFRRMSFYSGLPSSTPAVQAEVMYGVKTAVPAFQFLHRSSGQVFRMFEGEAARTIASELLSHGEPLLKGGASYSNIYSGGSEEAQCCAETRSLRVMLQTIKPLRLILTAFLYSFTLMRIAAMASVELLIAGWDMVSGLVQRDWQKEIKFVPMRVLVAIVLREWVRIVVKLSISSGTPIIYANLLGYDEQSHRRGPTSAVARWGLKSIDSVIKDIFKSAHREEARDYELIVFSDHGQEAVRIYEFEYGKSIQQAVTDALKCGPLADRMVTSIDTAVQRGRHTERWMSRLLRKSRGAQPQISITAEELVKNVIVTALGPLGHVYFPVPVTDEAKADCAARLVTRENVPLVLYRLQTGEVRGRNRRGLWNLPEDCSAICGTEQRFMIELKEDLIALCQHKDSGDLILSGWDPDLQPLTFVQENGSHGSIGFRETRGFALLPNNVPARQRTAANGEMYIRGVDLHQAALHFLDPSRCHANDQSSANTLQLSVARADDVTEGGGPLSEGDHTEDAGLVLRLRVMTYNAHRCVGMDGRCRPNRVAQVIAECGADVIALQEMDENRERTGKENQTQMIAARLGMYYRFFPVLVAGEERYGLSVLSRFPIIPVYEGTFSREPARSKSEARGAIWITLKTDIGPVHIINTHLGLRAKERLQQVDQLLGPHWLDSIADSEPVILCGDLNAGPKSDVIRRLHRRLQCVQLMADDHKPQPTFASMLPLRQIDHILVNHHFSVQCVSVLKSHAARLASDHLPVCADLTMHLPQPPRHQQDVTAEPKASMERAGNSSRTSDRIHAGKAHDSNRLDE